MKYMDDYMELYDSEEDWYIKYVEEELNKIRRKNHEGKRVNPRNK